jgi:hypothetical protein
MTLSDKETKALYLIGSENYYDLTKPEFPPDNPKFPATSTYKIKVPGFSNVWLKDESSNPTGTHRDRMAWEVAVTYRDFILAKKDGMTKGKLPQISIITSGSSAVAIQSMLLKYKLPNLKCLVGLHIDEEIIQVLESMGCEVYKTDLSKKPLHWKEILELTDNVDGIDVTSGEGLDPAIRFYDWLTYEVINQTPDYCFIPFGSGKLYENILNITKREVSTNVHDPRFLGDAEKLKWCNFIGSTINDPKIKAYKLSSNFTPFAVYDEQWIKVYRLAGYCGMQSNVHILRKSFLDQAIKLAEEQGINVEPSGIAGLGMLLQKADEIPKNKKILIISTGKTKYPFKGKNGQSLNNKK